MNNPLLPLDMVQKIPVEFAPLLITGYHVPISFFESPRPVVPENKIDEFLDAYPEYIQNGKINEEIINIIEK